MTTSSFGRAAAHAFYRAVVATDIAYDRRLFIRLQDASPAYPGFDVLYARPTSKLAQAAPLLHAVFERCQGAERALLLFDGLDTMAARWGGDVAARFFAACCPPADLGAIAYWYMSTRDDHVGLPYRGGGDAVRLCGGPGAAARGEAEGRPPGVAGSVFRCSEVDGLPLLAAAPMAARIGAALRAARLQRNLNQTDLARMAGVSSSAISQAERGHRGLSLETVLALSTVLSVTVDELLRGEVATGYRIGRGRRRGGRADRRADPPARRSRRRSARLPRAPTSTRLS